VLQKTPRNTISGRKIRRGNTEKKRNVRRSMTPKRTEASDPLIRVMRVLKRPQILRSSHPAACVTSFHLHKSEWNACAEAQTKTKYKHMLVFYNLMPGYWSERWHNSIIRFSKSVRGSVSIGARTQSPNNPNNPNKDTRV
jgi:hypothetical protein